MITESPSFREGRMSIGDTEYDSGSPFGVNSYFAETLVQVAPDFANLLRAVYG